MSDAAEKKERKNRPTTVVPKGSHFANLRMLHFSSQEKCAAAVAGLKQSSISKIERSEKISSSILRRAVAALSTRVGEQLDWREFVDDWGGMTPTTGVSANQDSPPASVDSSSQTLRDENAEGRLGKNEIAEVSTGERFGGWKVVRYRSIVLAFFAVAVLSVVIVELSLSRAPKLYDESDRFRAALVAEFVDKPWEQTQKTYKDRVTEVESPYLPPGIRAGNSIKGRGQAKFIAIESFTGSFKRIEHRSGRDADHSFAEWHVDATMKMPFSGWTELQYVYHLGGNLAIPSKRRDVRGVVTLQLKIDSLGDSFSRCEARYTVDFAEPEYFFWNEFSCDEILGPKLEERLPEVLRELGIELPKKRFVRRE